MYTEEKITMKKFAITLWLVLLTFTTVAATDSDCVEKPQADIYFLNDASNSINGVGWNRSLNFVANISSYFPFGPNDVQCAFGIFSSTFKHLIYLNQYYIYNLFAQAILSTVQLKTNTHTADAIDDVNDNNYLFDPSHGGGRHVTKIVILTTDGQSENTTATIEAANRLKLKSVKFICVGVGVINYNELLGVAGKPENVFTVKSFAGLEAIIQNITRRVCEEQKTTTATTSTTPEPTTSTPEPTTSTPEPTTPTPTPEICDTYPIITTTTTTPEPITTTPPRPITTRIITTTPEPITTTPEPITTTPEPTTTTPEPTTTTPIPTTSTTKEPTTTQPPNPCPPEIQHEICFAVDSSASIGLSNYKQNFNFIRAIVASFTLGKNATKIAGIIFGTHAYLLFPLTWNWTLIYQATENPPYRNSTTETQEGLKLCQSLFSNSSGSQDNIKRSIILVTDGKSTSPNQTLQVATAIKESGINIICLAVKPDADKQEMDAVASRPEYNIPVESYSSLASLAALVSNLTCHSKPPPPPVKTCPPDSIIDIILVVDSSGSIGEENNIRNYEFIRKIVDAYTLGEKATKFALCTFGTSVIKRFFLSDNRDYINSELDKHPYQNSTTNTDRALDWVLDSGVRDQENGARGGRLVVIVITDGKSGNPSKTAAAAKELKSIPNITVAVIMVGDEPDQTECLNIASSPSLLFHAANYNELEYLARNTSDAACNSGTTAIITTTPQPRASTTPQPRKSTKAPPAPVKPCPPDNIIDIIIVVDSSSSIGVDNNIKNYVFIRKIIEAYTLGENAAKFALSTFSTTVITKFFLSDDRDYIYSELDKHPYQNGTTNTHLALYWVLDSGVRDEENGARPDAAELVVIVITDGKSGNPSKTAAAAKELKAIKGITVIVISVGDEPDQKECLNIASSPNLLFHADNYDALEYLARNTSDAACNSGS